MTDSSTQNRPLNVEEVVVGWKPGEAASAALDWVLQRIERLRARLVIVAVVPPGGSVAASDAAVDAERELAEAARRVTTQCPSVLPETRVLSGDPAKQLAALTGPGRVVVVGTDRRRGLSVRYNLSLGTRLAARASGPVALIPHGARLDGHGVVVGVDGGDTSLDAARLAARIAASRGDELVAVHVWQEPTPWQDSYLPPDDAFLAQLQAVHQDVLDRSVAAFAEEVPGVTVTAKLVHGLAPWGLLDQAEGAALLVVGDRAARGIQRMLLGSVAHTVVLNLEGPTLIAPRRPASR